MVEPEEVDAKVTRVGTAEARIPVKLRKVYRREHELRQILDRDKTPEQLEEAQMLKDAIRKANPDGSYAERL